jgi:iron complex transport system ATP-binding protein
MPDTAALSARHICYRVADSELLREVDVHVNPGEVLGLIGPNGAGKTSLLKLLAGIEAPTSGTVLLQGANAASLDRTTRALRVAYLPQDAQVHWPLTVENVVALGRLPHQQGFNSRTSEDRSAVHEALRRTRTASIAHRNIRSLSGGERMRALVARMLAVQAEVLLADEPIAGLDPYFQLEFMDLFAEEANRGRAVILVLHDLALAARYCHRLVMLHQGRVYAQGEPQAVLTPDNIQHVYRIEALAGDYEATPYVLPWRRTPREL